MSVAVRVNRDQRFRKRVGVLFDVATPLRQSGFTTNISARGLQISSTSLHPVGTQLFFSIKLPDGTTAHLETRVVWARRGSQTLGIPNALGLRVLHFDHGWARFIAELGGGDVANDAGPRGPMPLPSRLHDRSQTPAPKATGPEMETNGAQPRLRRVPFALPVRFGKGTTLDLTGTTVDLSATGLAVSTATIQARNLRLFVSTELPGGKPSRLEGTVVWGRWSAPQERASSLMGLRISNADERWYQFLMELGRSG